MAFFLVAKQECCAADIVGDSFVEPGSSDGASWMGFSVAEGNYWGVAGIFHARRRNGLDRVANCRSRATGHPGNPVYGARNCPQCAVG